ncbi:MAG: hypothetical protein GH144_03960 [Clostridia bacterium]|jgi:titin|nr:hypothetical protein [Clostridia bacterium]
MKRKYLLLALMGLALALPGCQGCPIAPPPTPYPPSDLAGVAVSSSEINLTWKDNSADETGFYIYRKTTDNYSKVGVMEANATSHTDTGLSPQTTYSYKVTAYNEGGESDPSNEVTITTPGEATAPSAPSNLAGQAVSCSEINLSWQDNSTNEEGFYVYRKTTDDYSIIATMEANATSYNNTGLNPETAYSYKITAYNDIGESGFSNALCVHTPAEPLEPPSNPVAITVSYKQINLIWQDNSDDEDSFRINSDFGLGPGNNQFLVRLPANTTHYEHCNLQPMREYKYFVIAERSGESAASERFSATTPCPIIARTAGYCWPSETLVGISGDIQSNANEACRVDITVFAYDYLNWDLLGSAKETFELGAFGRHYFYVEIEVPAGDKWIHSGVEITNVEILY